jgi:hypothetical protein
MTRGTQASTIFRDVRAARNPLILQGESKRGKMPCAAESHGGAGFAHGAEKAKANQRIERELTPGPRGSGED